MKKVSLIFCLLFVIILLMTSCTHQITEGYVIDKGFIPAYTTTTLVNQSMVINGNVTVVSYPKTIYHPNTWYIIIENEGITRTISVSETIYNMYNINDWFIL